MAQLYVETRPLKLFNKPWFYNIMSYQFISESFLEKSKDYNVKTDLKWV